MKKSELLKIKRLFLINLFLVLSIIYLPSEKAINCVQSDTQIETQISTQQIGESLVTSRSFHRDRTEEETPKEEVTSYSSELVEFVKKTEGFKSEAYLIEGETYWTIGYGHHGSDVKPGQTITEEAAERLLIAELNGNYEAMRKYMSYLDKDLTQGQADALTSFTYNGGLGMLQQLTDYKKRNLDEIAEHIKAYTNNGMAGLVTRRNAEYQIFIGEGERVYGEEN